MVVPGENPRAVIMDFGLARAVNRSTPVAGGTLSLQGGTEDYMAPELLSGAVPTIRSDIFAFGKVARALMPRERLWDQCTRSHAEERLGSLDPVIRKLDEQRSRRYWFGGSVVLAAGALAYELLPPATRSLLLPKGTRLLINGFRAVAGEPATPGLLRSLVLTGVAQSPRITPVTDQDLLPVLRRIEPSAALPVSGGVLRDLLVSLRATFWIDGDTERRGSRLALTLRLLRTADNALVAEKEFGDVAGVGVLAALVAAWIRTASGESADSLKLNSAAAIQFTSQVPEALEKYFDAMAFFAVANMDQALPNFREAIRLDPNFAQAHSMLGACLNSYGRFEESFAEVGRAFQISATLPERERTWIEVNYFTLADDPVRMVEAARQNVAYHPDEPRFLRTLGRNLARTGNPSEGVSYIRHAVELAPDDALLRTDLMEVLCEAGQFDEASAIFEQRTDLAQRVPYAYRGKMYALLGLERYRDAAGVLESDPARDPDLAVTIKILRGDLEGTIADLESALGGMELSGSTLERFQANAFLCGLYFVTDRPAKAVPHLRAMLNFPNVPCRSKYFEQVAFWAGRLGDDATLGKASSILAESADRWPHPRTRMASDYASALVNLRNRNQSEAEALLLKASGVPWSLWSLFDLASLYTTNKKHDLAESHWDKFNSRRGMVLCYHFPGLLPLSWLFRGQSAQARGDRSSARLYGQKVLDLWSRQNGATHIVELARNLVEKT
jgi:Flp pilus assembly protein TadD